MDDTASTVFCQNIVPGLPRHCNAGSSHWVLRHFKVGSKPRCHCSAVQPRQIMLLPAAVVPLQSPKCLFALFACF